MLPDDDKRHGTTTGYREGCRNACCRRAVADAAARRRNRTYLERTDTLSVAPLGTHRRIQALVALGWSMSEISRRAGYDRSHVPLILRRTGPLHATTAQRISALYDEMSMCLPPAETKAQKIDASRARNLARRNGWLPPLMWNNPDDPNEQPTTHQRPSYSRDELLAEWDWLRRTGESMRQAADRLGVTVDAIEKAIERDRRSAA